MRARRAFTGHRRLAAHVVRRADEFSAATTAPLLALLKRLVDWASGLVERRPATTRRALVAALLASLALMTTLGKIDGVLREMHLADVPGRGVADLAGLRFGMPREDAASSTVRTWEDWRRGAGATRIGYRTPEQLLRAHVLLDHVFVAAYTLALAILLLLVRTRLARRRRERRRETYLRLLTLALPLVVLLAAADATENELTRRTFELCRDGCAGMTPWGLVAAAAAKWILLVLVLLPLLSGALALPRRRRTARFLRAARVLRVQVVAVILFAVVLLGPLGGAQAADMIRRWAETDRKDGVVAALLLVFFAAQTLFVSRRLLARASKHVRPRPVSLLWLAAAALLVLALAVVVPSERDRGLFALSLILLVVLVLSVPLRDATPRVRRRRIHGAPAFLPTLLALGPLVVLGTAVVGAAVEQFAYAGGTAYLALAGVGVALLAIAWGLVDVLHGDREVRAVARRRAAWGRGGDPGWRAVVLASAALVAVATTALALNPWAAGDAVGAIGVLILFLVALSLLGYLVQHFDRDWLPPQAFLALGIRRMPVVLVLAIWAAASAAMDDGGYHDVRRLPPVETAGDARPRTLGVDEAWRRWRTANGALRPERDGRAIPLVLVASEGGGLRAANWTARVLDCVLDGDAQSCGYASSEPRVESLRRFFAFSGASGGSLGLAATVAAVAEDERGGNWVDDRLGRDFVSPLWASLLFVDVPNALLKLNLLPDRAAVLERSWERAWGREGTLLHPPRSEGPLARGLFETYWAAGQATPLLLLSGTSVLDGCRVNNSVLRGAVPPLDPQRAPACDSMEAAGAELAELAERPVLAATYDLGELLCGGEDVRLSTAALLSARFPFITPSGRLARCPATEQTEGGEPRHALFVVDGGYYDNSGASALLELWRELEPLVSAHNERRPRTTCVVPMFLHVDNHIRTPPQQDPHRRPLELEVPLTAAAKARSGHEGSARQGAALEFRKKLPFAGPITHAGGRVTRHAYLYPRAEPGADAPLGWALSEATRTALRLQLGGANKKVVEHVRAWFSDELRCAEHGGA